MEMSLILKWRPRGYGDMLSIGISLQNSSRQTLWEVLESSFLFLLLICSGWSIIIIIIIYHFVVIVAPKHHVHK